MQAKGNELVEKPFKIAMQNASQGSGDLVGSKMLDKINSSEITLKPPEEIEKIPTSPEKRKQMMNKVLLV